MKKELLECQRAIQMIAIPQLRQLIYIFSLDFRQRNRLFPKAEMKTMLGMNSSWNGTCVAAAIIGFNNLPFTYEGHL
jgi:hypothetical protein